MKGFILAHGWSGTTWLAYALNECTDLEARHESMRKELGLGGDFGGVESNGNFWRQVREIRERYGCPAIHLVRDGRKVVRTHMARKAHLGRTFEHACDRWRVRNERLLEDVPSEHRYRLEDLTGDYGAFHEMAVTLGAESVDPTTWESVRSVRKNARRTPHVLPPYPEWTEDQQEMFWRICGPAMYVCGYRLS